MTSIPDENDAHEAQSPDIGDRRSHIASRAEAAPPSDPADLDLEEEGEGPELGGLGPPPDPDHVAAAVGALRDGAAAILGRIESVLGSLSPGERAILEKRAEADPELAAGLAEVAPGDPQRITTEAPTTATDWFDLRKRQHEQAERNRRK